MKDQKDNNTLKLFPCDLIITGLKNTDMKLKRKKEETRLVMKFEGYTNARFETDLCNDDYLNSAAELLVRLCCEDSTLARKYIAMIEEKYTIDDLCEFRSGANRPVVSGGCISMNYSTQVPFDMDCLIVEKATLIKLIAQWLLMLAKGDSHAASCAINTGYLRLVNSDDSEIFQAGDITVGAYSHGTH